jgi:hypothetical protein
MLLPYDMIGLVRGERSIFWDPTVLAAMTGTFDHCATKCGRDVSFAHVSLCTRRSLYARAYERDDVVEQNHLVELALLVCR